MRTSSMTVCWKRSGWDWDLHRYPAHDEHSLARFYREQNRDPERMQSASNRQNRNLESVRERVGNAAHFVSRNDLSRQALQSSELFVVGGGDNHFTWASHYCPFEIPMLLINSDMSSKPNEGSHGGLLNFSTAEFLEMLPRLEADEFEVEEWTLLEVLVNSQHCGFVTGEVFVGEKVRTNCSRNWLRVADIDEQHVGSGEVIATPAGASGWYHSAIQHDARIAAFEQFLRTAPATSSLEEVRRAWQQSAEFHCPAKTERLAFVANTERFVAGGRDYALKAMQVSESDPIALTSLNDSEGIIRIDAEPALTTAFPPGAEAIIRVAKETRKVVVNPFRT